MEFKIVENGVDMIENAISIIAICPYCKYSKHITFCFELDDNYKYEIECYACEKRYYVKKVGERCFTCDNNEQKTIETMK